MTNEEKYKQALRGMLARAPSSGRNKQICWNPIRAFISKSWDLLCGFLVGVSELFTILPVIVLLIVGPFAWMGQLLGGRRFWQFAVVLSLWLLSVTIIGSNIRKKEFSTFSLGVTLIWMIVLGYVFHDKLSLRSW